MVLTDTGKQGKPGKVGRHFSVREKSGNFVKTGKVMEFYSKYWKNQKKLYWKIEKNTGKVSKISQPVIEKPCKYGTILKKKKYWKTVKITGEVREKLGKFVSPKKWSPARVQNTHDFVFC